MILSDTEILKEIKRKNIVISPFDENCLGSNSYDLHLGDTLATYEDKVLDAKKHNKIKLFKIPASGFVLKPNQLFLGTTLEYTETLQHVPFLEGKSSTGRLGISIHETGGAGDIGFKGHWTLHLTATIPVKVYAGMPLGQIYFLALNGKVKTAYNKKSSAKYSGQPGVPVESMMWKNKF